MTKLEKIKNKIKENKTKILFGLGGLAVIGIAVYEHHKGYSEGVAKGFENLGPITNVRLGKIDENGVGKLVLALTRNDGNSEMISLRDSLGFKNEVIRWCDQIAKVTNDSDISDTIYKSIDERLFVELAPAIEEAVLNKGLEKTIIEEAYDLGDNLSKFVSVTVENVYGD